MDPSYLENPKELLDVNNLNYAPHTDRVLRPELVSSFTKPVKADVKKSH